MNLNSNTGELDQHQHLVNVNAAQIGNKHDNGHDSNANSIAKYTPLAAAQMEAEPTRTDSDSVHAPSQNGNVSKTRETVQKVYRLLERTRTTSTSSSIEEDELNDNLSRSANRISQQSSQRQRFNDGPARQAANDSQNRSSRSSQSPAGTRSSSSSSRQSPFESNSNQNDEPETEEESQLAKLRCPSLSTEAVSEREQRRRKRMCSDYPGLAFGLGSGSVFGSDTMMKFSLIKNELHNVINGQLKRAENEVATFNRRIQLIEDDLEKSKQELGSVTTELSEAVNSISSSSSAETEASSQAKEPESNEEDLLDDETKTQVRLISEESNKVYNEVVRRLIIMEKELETLQEREELNEMTIIAELRRQEMLHGTQNGCCIESQSEISQKASQKLDHAVDLLECEKDAQKLIAD